MPGLEDLYREIILDHYRAPRNRGELPVPPAHKAEGFNPLCGDEVELYLVVDGDTVTDLRIAGQGCSISQASASMLCERVAGLPLEDVKKLSKDDVLEMLGIELGPVRLKCALLALKTLKAGIYGLKQWPDEEDES